MTISDLRKQGLIILECISGSKAYGLDTPESDTDIKGVFILPKTEYYGLKYIPQINNDTNDVMFYEFGRFMELLSLNNPNILELLNTPKSSVLYKHPLLSEIKTEHIVSKLCKNTFGKFAYAQIKKAKGLNKKILNPMAKERMSILSFCYVSHKQVSLLLPDYLRMRSWKQEYCGLVKIPHMNELYGLYYSQNDQFNGIIRDQHANEVCLSSIPKDKKQETLLYFNKNGYSTYCKNYKEYWDWVQNRNETRYENTQNHGKNYDTKNMMHVFRLLDMAIEIGRDKSINVRRPNRHFLLDIKSGKYEYDELLNMANEKQIEMEAAFAASSLQEKPNYEMINELAYKLRDQYYKER
jgi:predicted nucleotidyltransferase